MVSILQTTSLCDGRQTLSFLCKKIMKKKTISLEINRFKNMAYHRSVSYDTKKTYITYCLLR